MRRTAGSTNLWYSTPISATVNLVILRGRPLSKIPQRLEGCLLPDGWEPSRLDKRGRPGWGSPYASEPLSSASGCRQGSSDKLARYQTKVGQCMSNFEEPCLVSGRTIRHVQPKPSKMCSSHSAQFRKQGVRYLISHYDGLIVVRPGGGFSICSEPTRGNVPTKDSGNAWASVEQV